MKTYRALLARAALQTYVGAAINSERVYYSLRNPPGQAKDDPVSGIYVGRLERGHCVDASDVHCARPAGLSGDRMRYMCQTRPDRSKVFRRSRTHKGSEGLLLGDVECKITRAYGNVPAATADKDR